MFFFIFFRSFYSTPSPLYFSDLKTLKFQQYEPRSERKEKRKKRLYFFVFLCVSVLSCALVLSVLCSVLIWFVQSVWCGVYMTGVMLCYWCCVGFETWKKDNDYGCVVLWCCVVLVWRLDNDYGWIIDFAKWVLDEFVVDDWW